MWYENVYFTQHNEFVNQRNGRDANAPCSHVRVNPQFEIDAKQQQEEDFVGEKEIFVKNTRTTHKLTVIQSRIRHKRKCLLQTRRKEAKKNNDNEWKRYRRRRSPTVSQREPIYAQTRRERKRETNAEINCTTCFETLGVTSSFFFSLIWFILRLSNMSASRMLFY